MYDMTNFVEPEVLVIVLKFINTEKFEDIDDLKKKVTIIVAIRKVLSKHYLMSLLSSLLWKILKYVKKQ